VSALRVATRVELPALVPAKTCFDCGSWPCRCHRALPAAAVRVRTEPCACGGIIRAVSVEAEIERAVAVHRSSTLHRRWLEQMVGADEIVAPARDAAGAA